MPTPTRAFRPVAVTALLVLLSLATHSYAAALGDEAAPAGKWGPRAERRNRPERSRSAAAHCRLLLPVPALIAAACTGASVTSIAEHILVAGSVRRLLKSKSAPPPLKKSPPPPSPAPSRRHAPPGSHVGGSTGCSPLCKVCSGQTCTQCNAPYTPSGSNCGEKTLDGRVLKL